jgi:DNA-binding MarR family transcriptional regulator
MDKLLLDNQLCFPLYAASKEIVRLYTPYLDKVDLTYTQYITMMVMWEVKEINVKELGNRLFLDSGTLTPLLKKLELKGYVERNRLSTDERNLIVKVTDKGLKLKDECLDIPSCVSGCVNLNKDEIANLYNTLYKILRNIKEEK